MMKRPAQRLLLAIGSTLFFLVLGEALARVGYSPQRVVNEGLFEYDRDKVYALRKNLSDGWFGGLPVTTNSLGHRDREIPRAKPRMGFRVLAIGDSVTFGHGVHAEETWPEALERELAARFPQRQVDVVNTAVPGNSPFQEYHDLRRALVLQPDAVVIQFVLNDLIEPYRVFRRYGGRGRDYHRVEDVLWWDYELSQRSALFLFIKDVVTRLRLGALTRVGMQTAALEEEAELSWTAAADPPDDPRMVRGSFPVLENVAKRPGRHGNVAIWDPPAAAIRQVQPQSEVEVTECHFVEWIEAPDVDVRFVSIQIHGDNLVEAIADSSANESRPVTRLALERNGRPSKIEAEYPALGRGPLGAGVSSRPEDEQDR